MPVIKASINFNSLNPSSIVYLLSLKDDAKLNT